MMLHCIIDPANDLLMLRGIKRDPRADRLMLAIALQETALRARRQYGLGPARGWWQFETVGLSGVLEHRASKIMARYVVQQLGLPVGLSELHQAIEFNDLGAACFARLLLWTDPSQLPDVMSEGWRMYLRTWRPGKPHPGTWAGAWTQADNALRGLGESTSTIPTKANPSDHDNVPGWMA